MDLWNITDLSQIDPVIDLILDVIAYNSSRLHQSIVDSDADILSRLARLMVPLKWSLPSPSHALMSVDPKFDEVKQLTTNDCFYARKMMFEKGWLELYFSPLSNYPLVNAKIRAIAFDQQVNYYTDRSVDRPVIPDVEIPSEEGTVWIGLNMTQSVLRSTKRLVLCILPEDGSLSPFLRDIEV